MKKAIKILVSGTVQGVFFRNFIKSQADKVNINGFVRNLDDGKVEIFAEGEIDDVDMFCDICKTGPKHAVIKEFKISESPFQDLKDFKVLHL